MVLGKKVATFDCEWGQNSAPREGQKLLCVKMFFEAFVEEG